MDLAVLRNFISIVEAGNVTAASERVHIAQPTLSKQLRQLENYYDAKLVITERGSRQIILTDAGRLLYEKAKYMCSLDDSAIEEIRSSEHGAAGTLRVRMCIYKLVYLAGLLPDMVDGKIRFPADQGADGR